MSSRKPKIVIIGPTYVDISVRCDSMPLAGQEVEGSGFSCRVSGAGPNRAIEASLCGCDTYLISKIGDDAIGYMVRDALDEYNINTDFLYNAQAMSTGVNVTLVDSLGENTTCKCCGANKALGPDEINFAAAEQVISDSDVCLIYGALPDDVVSTAIKTAKLYNTKVILEKKVQISDSGTMDQISCPKEYYLVDVFMPKIESSIEAAEMSSGAVHKLKMVGSEFVAAGIESVIINMGSKGTFVVDRSDITLIPSFEAECMDKNCCADAFAGALAASVGVGDNLCQAVKFASAAGVLASSKFNSAELMPTKEEIIELLIKQPD